jgi:hypothetical protein
VSQTTLRAEGGDRNDANTIGSPVRESSSGDDDEGKRVTVPKRVDLFGEAEKRICRSVRRRLTQLDFDSGPSPVWQFEDHIDFCPGS